jgi:hypothetical protein
MVLGDAYSSVLMIPHSRLRNETTGEVLMGRYVSDGKALDELWRHTYGGSSVRDRWGVIHSGTHTHEVVKLRTQHPTLNWGGLLVRFREELNHSFIALVHMD